MFIGFMTHTTAQLLKLFTTSKLCKTAAQCKNSA